MNKAYVMLMLAWLGRCVTVPANGQQPSQEVPAPKPPYVRVLPAQAAWTINFVLHYPVQTPAPKSSAWEVQSLRRQKVVKRTKDGTTMRLEITWTDGTTSEEWAYKDFLMITYPGIPEIQVSSRSIGPMADTLGSGDFPELGWVKAGTYKGSETHGGKMCYRFEAVQASVQNSNPASRSTVPPVTLIAWIDVNTHLPVGMVDGLYNKEYTFDSAAPASLILPAAFQDAMQKSQKAAAPDSTPRPLVHF